MHSLSPSRREEGDRRDNSRRLTGRFQVNDAVCTRDSLRNDNIHCEVLRSLDTKIIGQMIDLDM